MIKVVNKDENWSPSDGLDKTTEEFTNKEGQIVLKRTYNNGQKHDTYYVYDDFGNLTYVLPPKSEANTDKPNSTELSELCYQYVYDHRNRLVEQKIPGKGWEYTIYDALDRPVMTQDAIQASASPKEWSYTKYDALGRVAYTGIHKDYSNRSRTSMQSYFYTAPRQIGGTNTLYESRNASEFGSTYVLHHYSNFNFPYQNIEILTVNYYDDYNFNRAGGGFTISSFGITSEAVPKGYPTGSKTKVLGTTSTYNTSIRYYDVQGRIIGGYHYNAFLYATEEIKNKLDFTGKIIESNTSHTNTNDTSLGTQNIKDAFTYDHMGRLTKQTQILNSQGSTEVIVENTYDEIGRLIQKGIGGTTTQDRLQEVNYIHNVRGWLKQINDPSGIGSDLFAFKVNYNSVDHSGTELYNGNIAETEWKSKNDNVLRWYRYNYDDLNRITSATDNSGNYNVSGLSYDKNGNILTLQRKGHNGVSVISGFMDNLIYTYSGSSNRLTKVLDNGDDNHGFKDGANTSNEYTYDANGNMKKDLNKGILNINYNHLNLPILVDFGNNKYITYTYDAAGTKIRKRLHNSGQYTNTDYTGSFVYENDQLQFFATIQGYFNKTGASNGNVQGDYVYQYKDHVGNIRLSYADSNHDGAIDETTEIIEQSHYYPFGLKMKGFNTTITANGNNVAQRFKYNGVEFEEALGLDLYEMDVRQYDPALARWTSIDPVVHWSMSTYTGFDNNPIFWSDPSGADAVYNWGKKRYENGDGKEITFSQAMASYGLNSDGSICDDCKLEGGGYNGKSFNQIKTGRNFWGVYTDKHKYSHLDVLHKITDQIDDMDSAASFLQWMGGFLGGKDLLAFASSIGIQDINKKNLKEIKRVLKKKGRKKIMKKVNEFFKKANPLHLMGILIGTTYIAKGYTYRWVANDLESMRTKYYELHGAEPGNQKGIYVISSWTNSSAGMRQYGGKTTNILIRLDYYDMHTRKHLGSINAQF